MVVVKCCFLIDATASMGEWIEAAKTQTRTIVQNVLSSNPGTIMHVGAVFYRDVADFRRFEVIPFTTNIDHFERQVREVRAIGGGDICEDVAGGFERVVDMDWDNCDVRNLFLICDAPPHGHMWHDDTYADADDLPDFPDEILAGHVRQCARRRIDLTLILAGAPMYVMQNRMASIYQEEGRQIGVEVLLNENGDGYVTPPRSYALGESPPALARRGRHFPRVDEADVLNRTASSRVQDSIRESQADPQV